MRGGASDGVFIGLWLTRGDGASLKTGGFDGGYTYFASPVTSHGADPRHWRDMSAEAAARGLMFVPSVGPGYNDTKIRPWNGAATRSREGGGAFARAWRSALGADPAAVTITSYNEWGEGTQIEPAESGRPGYAAYDEARDAREGETNVDAALDDGRSDASAGDDGDGGDARVSEFANAEKKRADPELYLRMTREFAGQLRAGAGLRGANAAQARDEL